MRNDPVRNLTIFLLLLLGILVGLTVVNYRFSVANPGGNDFLARWMGARMWLVEGLSPYDERVSLETQQWIYGRPADVAAGEDVAHFVYPMYSMVFFGPFGLMEYPLARALWMTLLEASAVGLALLGLQVAGWRTPAWMTAVLVVFSLVWYHGARTIVVGQFAGLNALLILLALYLVIREQDLAAGIVLALTTSKPQMVYLLVPFVLLWAFSVRRFRIIGGFIGAFAALVAVATLLLPEWPLRMLGQMLEYPTYTHVGSPLSVLAAAAPGIQGLLNQVLQIVVLLYLLIVWFGAWKKDPRTFLWAAFMTIVVTNLTAFRTATTNYVMLLPVLFLVFRIWEQRWGAFGRSLVLAVLAALFVGLWWLFLVTVDGNIEGPAMYLPLPALSFFLLWWARWWAVRQPKLMLEEFAARHG